jgi:protein NDRG1
VKPFYRLKNTFQAFFNYPGMAELLPYFCVFHINAPGQEEGAEKLPEDFVYPNMEELSEQVRQDRSVSAS